MLKSKGSNICFYLALLLVLAVILIIMFFSPRQIFKYKFGFNLPKGSQIANYQLDFFAEARLKMKISFNNDDYDKINESIKGFFDEDSAINLDNEYLIPEFNVTCPWWDMNESEIIAGYEMFTSGIWTKTRAVYAFITQNADGQYFVYVVH
jgi:hypothetical protein